MGLLKNHWYKINWEGFEELCVYIAECIYPDRKFSKYKRQGMDQDGIDILTKNKIDETIICIQTKRYSEITLTQLKAAIEKFETGDFRKTAHTFIIATSADFDEKTLDHLEAEKQRFKNEYQITLEQWDNEFLEKELRRQWVLVAHYFGKSTAEDFCHPQGAIRAHFQLTPVEHYINRLVIPYDSTRNRLHWVLGMDDREKPEQLFLKDIQQTKRICLVADAYQGKSTLLREVALRLFNHPLNLKPVFIEIKRHRDIGLSELLDTVYTWWKSVPIKEQVIIIDGLDEVDSDKFLNVVRSINDLSLQYPTLSIVFSCRKLFYHHFEVQKQIAGFSIYELYPLQREEVEQFLKTTLDYEREEFHQYIAENNLHQFLYHPFFLLGLTSLFQEDKLKLPKTGIEVIQYFIDKAAIHSSGRNTRSGRILSQQMEPHKMAVQKLALIMQIAGLNSLSKSDAENLFSTDETDLLQHSALVNYSNEQWSFSNAIFQEYLAALQLKEIGYLQLVSLACVGRVRPKIKTKWIQTIVTILSIVDGKDSLRSDLLALINNDNPELLTFCDTNILDKGFRLHIFEGLLKKYEEKDIRPLVVYEDSLARFVNDVLGVPKLLIERIKTVKSEKQKLTYWQIARFLSLAPDSKNELRKLAISELEKTSNERYGSTIVSTLTQLQLGDKEMITDIISIEKLNQHRDFRTEVYELILQQGLVEQFFQYGLDGLKKVMNRGLAGGGMETDRVIQNFLLATSNRNCLAKLLQIIGSDEWVNFHDYSFTETEPFLSQVAKACVICHGTDPLIFLDFTKLYKNLGSRLMRDEFGKLDLFFEETKTQPVAVKIFLSESPDKINWDLVRLINPECHDFIAAEFEKGTFTRDIFAALYLMLRSANKMDAAEEMIKLYNDITKDISFFDEMLARQMNWEEVHQKRIEADTALIQDVKSFREGVIKAFHQFGELKEGDYHADKDARWNMHKDLKSTFISRFVYNVSNGETVSLRQCLIVLKNESTFDYFRLSELLHYNHFDKSAGQPLVSLLQSLYDKYIAKARFKNAVRQKRRTIYIKNWERILSEIFQKHQFPTESPILIEMLWMDMTGIGNLQETSAIGNRHVSLSEKIIKNLPPEGRQATKRAIVKRLKDGIGMSAVLENHVALSRYLKIKEAKDIILNLMLTRKLATHTFYLSGKIFLELGGKKEDLVPVLIAFSNYDEHSYLFLIDTLKDDFPNEVEKSLRKCMKAKNVSEERRIDAAHDLIVMGYKEGLVYIIKTIRSKTDLRARGLRSLNLSRINTGFALKQLKEVVHFILENGADHHFDSPKDAIVDMLYSLSTKSEKDLLLVEDFILRMERLLRPTHQNSQEFFGYAERIVEKFRESDKATKQWKEVVQILNELNLKKSAFLPNPFSQQA